jgi:hypothetical protein
MEKESGCPTSVEGGGGREERVARSRVLFPFVIFLCFLISLQSPISPLLYLQGEINVSGRVGSKQTRQIFLVLLLLLLVVVIWDGRGMVAAAVDPTRVPRRRRLRKEASIILEEEEEEECQ